MAHQHRVDSLTTTYSPHIRVGTTSGNYEPNAILCLPKCKCGKVQRGDKWGAALLDPKNDGVLR